MSLKEEIKWMFPEEYLEEEFEKLIDEYNSLMEDRQLLLNKKEELDLKIRGYNIEAKKIDFAIHKLKRKMHKDVSQGGN